MQAALPRSACSGSDGSEHTYAHDNFLKKGAESKHNWWLGVFLAAMQAATAARDDATPPLECRICRQPGDADMPLFRSHFPAQTIHHFAALPKSSFRPCRCDGSIRYVHEACLDQWISRKRTTHCEVCTYPIQFEQVVHGNTGQIFGLLTLCSCLHLHLS